MKNLPLVILLASPAGLVSCVLPVQGTGSVEALERQSPVTSPPNINEGQAAQAAAYYSSDRSSGRFGRRGFGDFGGYGRY